MSKGKLEGKVALVTGASSGIGEATAVALAKEGAHVAIAARREDRLKSLAQRIAESDGLATPIVTDVADEGQIREMVSRAHAELGRLDILVNNAGVADIGPIESADTKSWRRMVDINVLGLMYATHAVLPLMKAQGAGYIVNISSTASRATQGGLAVFSATKWSVNAFSEALRQEVSKDKIRVTVIEPGAVATEITNHYSNPAAKAEVDAWFASMTVLETEDIAAAIIYAVTQPPRVNVNEILIRPTESAGAI